jgi:hypothetical protein
LPHSSLVTSPVAKAASVTPLVRRLALVLLGPVIVALAGCGAATVTANSTNTTFSLSPGIATIDTNCTGCNSIDSHGQRVHQLAAILANGSPAAVNWSVSGGDASAGAGTINAKGQYTPPNYLSADQVEAIVTARLVSNPNVVATARLNITPGFLQPLTPANVAVGANGSVTLSGRLAEVGGHAPIHFALANTATGTAGGSGSLGMTNCQRSPQAFTSCTVTYTAPTTIPSNDVTYVVASAGTSNSKTETEILLNTAAVTSNPAAHQGQLATLVPLGSSGGNNNDYDAHGNTIADCCSGTLGALIQDASGKQFLLSNDHVLARSDHASVGDAIVQPGLIDNNCTPNGDGPGTIPVASLTGWLPLKSPQTNADAAIAQVASRTVDTAGSILELGARQADGTLASAPPGVSSTNGKGETASLSMKVVKSGRTTGLTCANISAVDLDVSVDYFRDCAETRPYFTKVFTRQIAISGDRFGDAGDSGALVVDSANAEPVGLFFAGGTDASGVSHAIANPASDVLTELGAQLGGANYSFVGGADHAVSCLSYGDSAVAAAQGLSLSDEEIARGQQALFSARQLVNASAGILGVSMGKSSDHPGEAAVIVYVDESGMANVPSTVEGVRTMVIPTNAHAVAVGTAPLSIVASNVTGLPAAKLAEAMTVKQRTARSWMRQNPAFFGIGVGQSLDNPRESALVIYVDRTRIPAQMPRSVAGLRTRYIFMDRLHVTRSYASAIVPRQHCLSQTEEAFDAQTAFRPKPLDF